MKLLLLIRYIIFVAFKTALYSFVYFLAWQIISQKIEIDNDSAFGAACTIILAAFGWYDWIRSVLLFWWIDDNETFPLWWSGGRPWNNG